MDDVASLKNNIYRLSPHVYIERFEDGALVVCLGEYKLIELNPTADEILSLADGKRSIEQVAVYMAQEHEITVDDVLQDIEDLYKQLQSWKILEEVQSYSNESEKEI